MGKIPSDHPHNQPPTFHFSHVHPLNLINFSHPQQTLNPSSTCAGCKLRPFGIVYSCIACNYFLHKKCFDMPKSITHPFHKEHTFTLLPVPAYAEGVFSCDACGEAGNGFSYHCKPCGIDLHVLCAALPLSISHACHVHKLDLAFENPCGEKLYSCYICKNNGSGSNWLYRCNSCGFDAHLNCARGILPSRPPPPQPQNNTNFSAFQTQAPMAQPATTLYGSTPQPGFGTHFMPQPNPIPLMNNAAYGMPVIGGQAAMPQFAAANRQYEIALQAIQQMIQNNNTIAQGMLAGGTGGFTGGLGAAGYGGDRGQQMQQLMQLISSFNNGGGGGIGGLNGFGVGGGGGGGQEILQALMNGGGVGGIGGGGLDFLQNLMGGGGGFDLLGGALGGLGLF